VRIGVAFLLSLAVAHAAPHPKPRASVAPFTTGRAPADEELGYFGPEVARVVAAALESAGVEGDFAVAGRIEALDGDRVRLTAVTRGRSVSAEGPIEGVDQVARELGARLVTLFSDDKAVHPLPPGKKEARSEPKPDPEPPRPETKIEAKSEPAKSEPAKSEPAKSEPAKSEPAKSEPAKSEPAKSEPAKSEPAKSEPAAPRTESPQTEPPKAETPKTDIFKNQAPKMPDVLPAYPPSNYHPWGGFVAGRVVAHAIPDPPSSYVGTGVSATQALYGFLGRRLRQAVVPTGVGITSPQLAADEGWRSSARSVVMARIDNLEYLTSSMGVSVRLRLQVVVVREGRTVFRRIADSPLSDPSRRTDPVYQAVSSALETLVNELASVLGAN
jgi:hypothetical protein